MESKFYHKKIQDDVLHIFILFYFFLISLHLMKLILFLVIIFFISIILFLKPFSILEYC